jgi:hypothetical protein
MDNTLEGRSPVCFKVCFGKWLWADHFCRVWFADSSSLTAKHSASAWSPTCTRVCELWELASSEVFTQSARPRQASASVTCSSSVPLSSCCRECRQFVWCQKCRRFLWHQMCEMNIGHLVSVEGRRQHWSKCVTVLVWQSCVTQRPISLSFHFQVVKNVDVLVCQSTVA